MSGDAQNRLLTFEIGSSLFALPIEGVHEVAEMAELACIPTLPRDVAGVINYRGDALPGCAASGCSTPGAGALEAPQHVLVIQRSAEQSAVPRARGRPRARPRRRRQRARGAGTEPVAERRPLDGRLLQVVDAPRLVARARKVIEDALARGE